MLDDPRGEEVSGEDGLGAAGGAGDERGAGARQASHRDQVESGNAGGVLGDGAGLARHELGRVGYKARAASTCAAFPRSPVALRRGAGASRTTVGVVRMR